MLLRRVLTHRKDQVLVAVPAEIRQVLAVGPGEAVYWQITHRNAAMLTRTTRAPAGRPISPDLTRRVRRQERDIRRLRARLVKQPERAFNAGFSQGYSRAVAAGPLWIDALARVMRELEDIRDRVDETLALTREQRRGARRTPGAAASADAHPSPPPPPADVVIDGGADTSGAKPPGVPVN